MSEDSDTARAVTSVLDQLGVEDAALSFVFYSPEHDPGIVAELLAERAGGRAVGGSTAGELVGDHFRHGSVVGFSIQGKNSRAAIRAIGNVDSSSLLPFTSLAADLAERLGLGLDDLDPRRHVFLGLFDGLGAREEMVVPFFTRHSSHVPLVGGSLGDEERMERVTLVHDGVVHENAIAIALLDYDGPLLAVHHTHHTLTDISFEVTEVGGDRLVRRLDGRPAASAYADAIGVGVERLDDTLTSSHPLGYRFRGRPFPCSIMKVNEDGSLLMAYGVQRGERLNLLAPSDLVATTRTAIANAIGEFGQIAGHPPESMLAFHCLGRYREARRLGVTQELYDALHQLPVVGLNTYGEQFGTLHMNHSLTAVLFG